MLATAARGGRAGLERALFVPRRGLSALVDVVRGGSSKIAVVTMQRAPVNSLNLDLIQELSETLKKLEDDDMEGVVLASNQKVFSAGLDLDYVARPHEMDFPKLWAAFEELWYTLYTSKLSTVAAIEASAPAGGSILALSCDYRIVADNPDLRMGLNEVQLGMVFPRWLQGLCAQTVGERNSEFLLQRGHLMNPEEALKYGFVDEVVPKEDVFVRAFNSLEFMIKVPRQTRFQTKFQQRQGIDMMAGAWSGKALFDRTTSKECSDHVAAVMAQLESKKKS